MPVEIQFDADLTKVRAELDKLAADARSRPVVVNATAATGGVNPPGTIATPGSNAPNAGAILGGRIPLAGNVGAIMGGATWGGFTGGIPVAGQPGGSWGVGNGFWGNVAALGQAPATPAGFWGGNPQAQPGFPPPPPPPPPPLPPSPGRSGWGSAGYGRLIGMGTVANIATHALYSERQYNISNTLAGTDQAAQVDAMLAFRDSIASSGGFIGRGIAYLQDPSGMDEASIRATLRSSEISDARRGRISDVAESTLRRSEGASVYGERGTFARAMRTIDNDFEQSKRALDQGRREFLSKDRAEAEASVVADLTNHPEQITERWKRDYPNVDPEHWNESQEMTRQKLVQEGTDALMAGREKSYNDKYYDPSLDALRRSHAGQSRDLIRMRNIDIQSMNRAAGRDRLRGQGMDDLAQQYEISDEYDRQAAEEEDPQRRAAIEARGAAAVGSFKDRTARRRDQAARDDYNQADAMRELINRNPLRARIAAVDYAEQAAYEDDPEMSRNQADATARRAQTQRDQITQADSDRRYFRDLGLSNRGQEIAIRLADPVFGGLTAKSFGITADALSNAERLAREDTVHNGGAIEQVLRNAAGEQQLLKQDLLNSFKPQEFDPNRTNLTSSGGNGDIIELLTAIRDNTAKLQPQGPPRAQ